MRNETVKLTIRLPREEIDFAKGYAKSHGISVTEMFDRYLRGLRSSHEPLSAEIREITGIIPGDINAKQEYRNYQWEKYGR